MQKFLNRRNTRLFFTVRKSCHNIELITNWSIIERDRGTTDTNFWMFADIDDEKIIFDIVFFFSFLCSWYEKENEKLNFILKLTSQQFQMERRNVFQLRHYSWDIREILWIFLNSWRTFLHRIFRKKVEKISTLYGSYSSLLSWQRNYLQGCKNVRIWGFTVGNGYSVLWSRELQL